MTALRLGSLFDGIGVFPLAAVRCGIEPVWASEIEKAPISITKRHFPDMVHWGDVTKLDAATLNRLIKEIVVHERIDEDKTRHISIEIHFNLKPIPEVEQVTA